MVKTPCARDRTSNQIVFAPRAVKKRKHACLECEADVVVHRGPKLVPHFTHLVPRHGGGGCGGGGESELHRSTKEWIKSIANDPAFVVWTNCIACSVTFDVFRGSVDTKAETELRAHAYIVDVALHSCDRVSGFVEVFHTHATSEQKRAALEATAGWACPVMEIKAVNLVQVGFPKRFECVSPRRCTRCLRTAIRHRRDAMSERYAAYFRAALRTFRVRRLLEAMLVDDAINAIAAVTEHVVRRWLFLVRAKSLAARLRRDLFAPCVVCDVQARKHDVKIRKLHILRFGEEYGAAAKSAFKNGCPFASRATSQTDRVNGARASVRSWQSAQCVANGELKALCTLFCQRGMANGWN